jgi:DHA1 family bicyclomycin/chloramphenicol resistance-like MFS transporter
MKPRALILILAALSMIGSLSYDAYLPALPAIAGDLKVSLVVAQQSLTIYMFAFATMTLFYGTLADSFGRRPVMLIALALYLAGTIGVGCAATLGWLMFFRLVQGACAGAGSVISNAIINDIFTGREAERMTSYVSMLFGLAPAIAPIFGGYVQVWLGWRAIFLFIAIFSLVLLVVCVRQLPESLPREKRHAFHFKIIVANYWQVARHGDFLMQSAANALAYSGLMIYIGSASAFIFNVLHLKATDFGWLFLPLIAGLTLGSMAAGRMSHRYSGAATIRAGYVILALSAVANVFYCALCPVVSVPWATLPVAVATFGAAMAGPAMTVRSLSLLPNVRGLVSSLLTFTFMMFFSIGSGVFGPLLFGSALKLALGMAGGTVLSAVLWIAGTRSATVPENSTTVAA